MIKYVTEKDGTVHQINDSKLSSVLTKIDVTKAHNSLRSIHSSSKRLHSFAKERRNKFIKDKAEKDAYKEKAIREVDHAKKLQEESEQASNEKHPMVNFTNQDVFKPDNKKIGHDHQTHEDIFADDTRQYVDTPEDEEKDLKKQDELPTEAKLAQAVIQSQVK